LNSQLQSDSCVELSAVVWQLCEIVSCSPTGVSYQLSMTDECDSCLQSKLYAFVGCHMRSSLIGVCMPAHLGRLLCCHTVFIYSSL
jgi:hypothetical protein